MPHGDRIAPAGATLDKATGAASKGRTSKKAHVLLSGVVLIACDAEVREMTFHVRSAEPWDAYGFCPHFGQKGGGGAWPTVAGAPDFFPAPRSP